MGHEITFSPPVFLGLAPISKHLSQSCFQEGAMLTFSILFMSFSSHTCRVRPLAARDTAPTFLKIKGNIQLHICSLNKSGYDDNTHATWKEKKKRLTVHLLYPALHVHGNRNFNSTVSQFSSLSGFIMSQSDKVFTKRETFQRT